MDSDAVSKIRKALELKPNEFLLGLCAERPLLATTDAAKQEETLAKTLLVERGIDPENWRNLLSNTAQSIQADVEFFPVSLVKGVQTASMVGKGRIEIRAGIVNLEGRETPSMERRITGAILSFVFGVISLLVFGLVEGHLSSGSFGFGVGGGSLVVFGWWNFCKGATVWHVSHLAQRRAVVDRRTFEVCLELDSGLWASFKIMPLKVQPSVYPLALFRVWAAEMATVTTPKELWRGRRNDFLIMAMGCSSISAILAILTIVNICDRHPNHSVTAGLLLAAVVFGLPVVLAIRFLRRAKEIDRAYEESELKRLFAYVESKPLKEVGRKLGYSDLPAQIKRAERISMNVPDPAVLIRIAKEGENPQERLDTICKINDQALLTEIAKRDPVSLVRIAAIERITDLEVLKSIQRTDTDADVKQAAIKRSVRITFGL